MPAPAACTAADAEGRVTPPPLRTHFRCFPHPARPIGPWIPITGRKTESNILAHCTAAVLRELGLPARNWKLIAAMRGHCARGTHEHLSAASEHSRGRLECDKRKKKKKKNHSIKAVLITPTNTEKQLMC